jgi:DNA polymerase-1
VEADDVIGTLAVAGAQQGFDVVVSSGDKDLAQLVTEHITIIDTMNGKRRDLAGVEAEFGVPARLMIDFQTLVGDTVDNVPGVPKVGPKTAAKWLQEFGSLEALVARADEVKGVAGQNLRDALGWLPTGRSLVTIKTDCDLNGFVPGLPSLESIAVKPANTSGLADFYAKFGFKGLLRTFADKAGVLAAPAYVSGRSVAPGRRYGGSAAPWGYPGPVCGPTNRRTRCGGVCCAGGYRYRLAHVRHLAGPRASGRIDRAWTPKPPRSTPCRHRWWASACV